MEKRGSEDIAFEILTWLPSKSLMRFKCISKAWNTCIRHPNFVKLHYARSQVRPSGTHLLFELDVFIYRIHHISNSPAKKKRLEGFSLELMRPRHCFNNSEMNICSNHCNGLVCLYNFKDTRVYLYNVSTAEMKALPFSLSHIDSAWDPRLFLGFDKVTEKYKLLHIFVEANSRMVIKTGIITLGINCWREIIMPRNCFLRPRRCIYLDGVLYSINRSLTYFNFTEEKFGNMPFPQHTSFNLNIMQTALWGKLFFHCTFYDSDVRPAKTDMLYDDVNKIFTKFVNNSNYPTSEKVALLETEMIDKTKEGNTFLATSSIISAPTSFLPPDSFILISVSRFVENITPLIF